MRGLFLLTLVASLGLLTAARPRPEPRWWRGNTHTHTLWSDGDGAPELSADLYKSRGYHFLVLSDHNITQSGEKWVKLGEGKGSASPASVEALVAKFGKEAVELRERDGVREMRLKTMDELRKRFEGPAFILIPGEEISDSIGPKKLPLHHNSLNHAQVIKPTGGETMREAMAKTVAAVEEESKRTGKPMLVHLNHPNFHWAVTADDLAHVLGERFFEVYNGHRGVRNYGDGAHVGTEAIWDYANALRRSKLDGEVLYGLATDDVHNYHKENATANAFRGWIWVRADALTPEAIVAAMQAGDFYASSGVRLEEVARTPQGLSVRVAAEAGVGYVIKFVGTKAKAEVLGEVLQRTEGPSASYRFKGDELYVRAVVVSSRRHPNGYDPDDLESAWTQPVTPPK